MQDMLQREVERFLRERGCLIDESAYLFIDSLDYLALIMSLEAYAQVRIRESVFFAGDLVDGETLTTLCERLQEAILDR